LYIERSLIVIVAKMSDNDEFEFREAASNDVLEIAELEALSFPPDEMASYEAIIMRQKNASPYMIVVRNISDNRLIGFVNGTLTTKNEIHHESMSIHESNGESLVIHSVTIDPAYRRKGIGKKMLQWYINKIVTKQLEVKRILLLTKELLVTFYKSCGFEVVKLSDVEHGVDKWYEMSMDLLVVRENFN